MNKPYVKQYNDKGEVSNPITKEKPYLSPEQNRQQRRQVLQKDRFFGESKNFPLVVTRQEKYLKAKQYEVDKDGNRKVILNYIKRNGIAVTPRKRVAKSN